MQRRRRINPKDDATFYIDTGGDKAGLDVQYINAIKGHGIFTSIPFQKGDFLIEYRGELISKQECERRLKLYPVRLKVFMFDFHFDGKLVVRIIVDAAKEDESLGRLVNDDHRNPTAKMKQLSVQGKPHLCLFADRDISPGEEITYNYGLDEVMPLETCGATEATSPNENIEEMVKNSDCTESYTKTTGPVLSPLSRAEKHCLRIATISSLDRSVSCVGPVSSFKWLGYECREFSVYNLEEAVKPANFQRVVQAVKKVSGFDDKHHTYSTPSLALKLGHTLLKISDIIHCRALMAEDDELIKSTKMFQKLYTSKWSEFVSHSALNTEQCKIQQTINITLHRRCSDPSSAP
ncbi:hypothetical protein NQZ68_026296 [Dissostichus eleginoides]|nr:hypothetical protein NQZ68_026296 [Dissostichus eleginoides]